jgi:hypothetical protein
MDRSPGRSTRPSGSLPSAIASSRARISYLSCLLTLISQTSRVVWLGAERLRGRSDQYHVGRPGSDPALAPHEPCVAGTTAGLRVPVALDHRQAGREGAERPERRAKTSACHSVDQYSVAGGRARLTLKAEWVTPTGGGYPLLTSVAKPPGLIEVYPHPADNLPWFPRRLPDRPLDRRPRGRAPFRQLGQPAV